MWKILKSAKNPKKCEKVQKSAITAKNANSTNMAKDF